MKRWSTGRSGFGEKAKSPYRKVKTQKSHLRRLKGEFFPQSHAFRECALALDHDLPKLWN